MPRQYRPGRGDVYWRRRVIALAGGIAVLGVVVWTVNGTLGGGGTSQSANVTPVGGHHSAPPSTSLAGTPSPSATWPLTPSPTPTATSSATATHRAGKHQASPAGQHASQGCPRADVVLSLFATRYRYQAHATPRFQLDVV